VGFGVGFSGLGTQILRFWGAGHFFGFWVTFSHFLGCRFLILRCRSLFSGFGVTFLENAALFPPGKKTPHFLDPESKFPSVTTHFLMPMLSLPSACPSLDLLFRGAAYNAGLSPCSHTTTTDRVILVLTPGRVLKMNQKNQLLK